MSDINDFGKSDPDVWTSFQYFKRYATGIANAGKGPKMGQK